MPAVAGPFNLRNVLVRATGQLQIRGAGLKTFTRKGVAAGTHTFLIAFTHAGRLMARTRRETRVTVKLVGGGARLSRHRKVSL
ncbi:MAG TPA: hypothetical protein VMU32_03140 [Solirubrobacteraceae bacterium]|nr:hypothetical protein [Solirubrobacteraceae bacterium]